MMDYLTHEPTRELLVWMVLVVAAGTFIGGAVLVFLKSLLQRDSK